MSWPLWPLSLSAAHRHCRASLARRNLRGLWAPYEDRMRVLGIDPGSLITGFGVVEDAAGSLSALAWGAVRTNARQSLHVRLKHIYDGLSEALHTWQPEAVAVERVFFADNPRTALI